MKKEFKILCASAVLASCIAFPAFAAETKEEYKEEVAPIKNELRDLETSMKPLREENKAVAAKYKSIRLEKKNSGTLSVSKENWKKAKELHQEIVAIRKNMDLPPAKAMKAETKEAVKNNDFDSAMDNMNQILENKKLRYDSLKDINDLWQQIDDLIS